MNYSIIRYILCRVLEFEGAFLILPCIVLCEGRLCNGILKLDCNQCYGCASILYQRDDSRLY